MIKMLHPRRTWILPIALCASLLPTSALVTAADPASRERPKPDTPVETRPSALQRLADQLSERPSEERVAFARTALQEMIATYLEAIEAPPAKPGSPQDRHKLASWRAGAYAYVEQLRGELRAIDRGATVDVLLGPLRTPQILIDGRPVLMEAPRPREALAMETRIVAAHCLAHDCVDPDAEPPVAPPVRSSEEGDWRFDAKQGALYVIEDGIVCLYVDVANRAEKESLCRELAAEARRLLSALREARQAAALIDWDAIHVSGSPGDEMQAVVLNAQGQYLELSLPRLVTSTDLSDLVVNWARARLAGQPQELRLPGPGLAPSLHGNDTGDAPAPPKRKQR